MNVFMDDKIAMNIQGNIINSYLFTRNEPIVVVGKNVYINGDYFSENKNDVINKIKDYILSSSEDEIVIGKEFTNKEILETILLNESILKVELWDTTLNMDLLNILIKSKTINSIEAKYLDINELDILERTLKENNIEHRSYGAHRMLKNEKLKKDYHFYKESDRKYLDNFIINENYGPDINNELLEFIQYYEMIERFEIPIDKFNDKELEKILELISVKYIYADIDLKCKSSEFSEKRLATLEKYKDLRIKIKDSEEIHHVDSFLKTQKKLNSLLKPVLAANLSEYEKYLYIYDIVKSYKYTEVPTEMSKTNSRGLNEIMDGPYIVCVGYAKFLEALLKKAGITARSYSLTGRANGRDWGHQRNEIFIKDTKYNLFFSGLADATWDSRREHESSCLRKYAYANVPYSKKEEVFGEEYQFSNSHIKIMSTDNFEDIKNMDINKYDSIYKFLDHYKIQHKYTNMDSLDFLRADESTDDVEYLFNILTEVKSSYVYPNKHIFAEALINVRNAQYKGINPEEMITEIATTVKINYKISFQEAKEIATNAYYGIDQNMVKAGRRI